MTDIKNRDDEDEIVVALKRFGSVLFRLRKSLFLGIVFGIVLAIFTYALVRPYYTASATIVAADSSVQPNQNSSSSLNALASLAGVGSTTAQLTPFDRLQIVLKSREMARRLLVDERACAILFPDRWDVQNKQWRNERGVIAAIRSLVRPAQREPDADTALTRLYRHLDVRPDKADGTVLVDFTAFNHDDANYMLNLVLGRADDIVRYDYLQVAQGYAQYINRELPDVTAVSTRLALTDLLADYQRTIVMARANIPFSFLSIDPVNAPNQPSGPSILLYLAAGAILGLVGGASIALAMPALPGWRVRTAEGRLDNPAAVQR